MSIEKLDEEIRLPLDIPAILSGEPDKLSQYMTELVNELEERMFFDLHQRVNLMLELNTGSIVYLGNKNSGGAYPTGTWRINASSATEYLIQLMVASTWTTMYTLSSGGLITVTDLSLSSPSSIYALSHDSFTDFLATEHFLESSINHTNIIAGSGSDHSDVALNTVHSASDGKDHSDVVLNNASRHDESHTVASHSDTTATGAELETLTDTSNADALHDHTESSVTVTHASTTGQAADDHHTESHTVASHNDTTATGAELETLTDTSNADALHAHAHSAATGQTVNDHHNEAHTVASHSDTTATGAELETLTDGSNADSLHVHASEGVTRYTTTATIGATDEIVFCNTGAAWTLSLLAGVADKTYRIVNTGTGGFDLTITPNGAENLIGANTSFILRDGESLIITYNATDGWY